MNYQALLDRIMHAVDGDAYVVDASLISPAQREAMTRIGQSLDQLGPEAARALALEFHEAGKIDRVAFHNALHVVAASPQVADHAEAARQVALQEDAALEVGGPELQQNLASIDRHRGVLAFQKKRYAVALDYFSRAFERQRAAGNLANVLATLLRLGDEADAVSLLGEIRASFPAQLVAGLDHFIASDPDLALLRTESVP